jgi:hypothetical protein
VITGEQEFYVGFHQICLVASIFLARGRLKQLISAPNNYFSVQVVSNFKDRVNEYLLKTASMKLFMTF